MEFTITDTQRSLPGTSTGVQGRYYTGTGQDEVYRQMGDIGSQIGAFGEKWYKLQGEAELVEKISEANEGFQQLQLDLMKEPDPEQYKARYDDYWNSVKSAEVKNGYARQRWKAALPTLNRSQQSQIFNAYKSKVRENHEIATANVIAQYVQGGASRESVVSMLNSGKKLGKTDAEIELVLGNADEQRQFNDINGFLRQKDYVSAYTAIASSGLDEKTKMSLEASISTQQEAEKRRAEHELELAQTANANELLVRIARGGDDIPTSAELIQALGDDKITHIRWKNLNDYLINPPIDTRTPPSTNIAKNYIIRDVTNGDITLEQGLERYETIIPNVNVDENAGNIDKIFAAAKNSDDNDMRRRNSQLSDRQKKLRDAIERQPNFLDPDEGSEVLEDLANDAINELNDEYDNLKWDKIDEVDRKVDELIRRYSLSPEALSIAVNNKALLDAETFIQQQIEIRKLHDKYIKQGNNVAADIVLEEAIKLGLAEKDGTPTKGKKDKVSSGALKRILDSLRR